MFRVMPYAGIIGLQPIGQGGETVLCWEPDQALQRSAHWWGTSVMPNGQPRAPRNAGSARPVSRTDANRPGPVTVQKGCLPTLRRDDQPVITSGPIRIQLQLGGRRTVIGIRLVGGLEPTIDDGDHGSPVHGFAAGQFDLAQRPLAQQSAQLLTAGKVVKNGTGPNTDVEVY